VSQLPQASDFVQPVATLLNIHRARLHQGLDALYLKEEMFHSHDAFEKEDVRHVMEECKVNRVYAKTLIRLCMASSAVAVYMIPLIDKEVVKFFKAIGVDEQTAKQLNVEGLRWAHAFYRAKLVLEEGDSRTECEGDVN